MHTGFIRAAMLGTALALAGCATQQSMPTQVTRFHLGQPIAPGEVAVESRDPRMAGSLEFQTYANAISAELARNGFRPAANVASSELVAVVDVMRDSREGPPRPAPFSIGLGIGGGSFGRRSAVGGDVGVGIPVGHSRSREEVLTQVAVQLKRRSDGTVIWEGRARTAALGGTAAAAENAAAVKIASALFQGFPGQSGQTITVR